MTIEQRLIRIEKNQERTNALLHQLLGNTPDQIKGWKSYEDAAKILNKSKAWYRKVRNGYSNNKKAILIQNKDWRKVGNDIEYYLPAIQELKERMINRF